MITYFAAFAIGALALLYVIIGMSPDEDPQMLRNLANELELRKAIEADKIRRRYESECD